MVGAEAELAAGLQLGRDHRHRPVVHHPALGVLGLGPGIGVEQVEHRQRAVGHPLEHLERVAVMDADVAQRTVAHVDERLGDPVDEGLGTDETVIGQQVGAVRQMLAAAEADLEVQRAFVAEQRLAR